MDSIEMKVKVLLTIPIPLLLAVMIVMAPISVYATNESSYRLGFTSGKNEWFSCDSGGDCHNAVEDCHSAAAPASSPANTQVTNETACVHGFINAYNRYCNHIEAKDKGTDMNISCPTTWKVQTFYFIGKTFANGTDVQQKGYWIPKNG